MKMNVLLAGVAILATTFTTAATAAINAPIPVSAYITLGGLDWAWAIPLPGAQFANALSYQGTQGWRYPTAAELGAAPLATNFLKPGGNVPFNGTGADGANFQVTNATYTGAGACASPYFNTGFLHCDWQDGNGQPFGPWAPGNANNSTFADQLFVRVSASVPEPASWALLTLGFGMVGSAIRRRHAATVAA